MEPSTETGDHNKNVWAMPDKWQELTYAFERDAHIALRQGRIKDCLQSCHHLLIRLAALIPPEKKTIVTEKEENGKKKKEEAEITLKAQQTQRFKHIEGNIKFAYNLFENYQRGASPQLYQKIYSLTYTTLIDLNVLMLDAGVYFPKGMDPENFLFKH